MVKKIRLSCVEGTIHPKLLKGPFILSFVEGRLYERERVRASCASSSTVRFPRASAERVSTGLNFEVEMRALNRPRR